MNYSIKYGCKLLDAEKGIYKTDNFKPTGETIIETFPDGSSHTLVCMKGKFTPFGMCRDCGDHFIIARYDRFDKVIKSTMQIVTDAPDTGRFGN